MKPLEQINGISIIICCYNSEKRIAATLSHIKNQKLEDDNFHIETIVVNNNSTDNTFIVASGQPMGNIELKIINENMQGKANAIERGFNEARYNLMILCDDDNWLNENYIQTCINLFKQNPGIGLLGGYGIPYTENGELPDWFNKYQYYYVCGKHHKTSGFLPQSKFNIWGAGSALRKSTWNKIKDSGFKFINSTEGGKAMGEDAELAIAVRISGFELYFDENLHFTHDLSGGRLTWNNFINHVKLNGKCNASVWLISRVNELKDIPLNECIDTIKKEINKYKGRKLYRNLFFLFFQTLGLNDKYFDLKIKESINELIIRENYYLGLIPSTYKWINTLSGY